MLSSSQIVSLISNHNTGVEYEYALYYSLLKRIGLNNDTNQFLEQVIDRHDFKNSILSIATSTDTDEIISNLRKEGRIVEFISIETQNDEIGPADIVFHTSEGDLGVSIKYSNTCNLNISGKYFLSPEDISYLKNILTEYSQKYIDDMEKRFVNASYWFRNRALRSTVTDEYIDIVRDRVISNWPRLSGKVDLVRRFFQEDSPIPFWIYEYKTNGGYSLNTHPPVLSEAQISRMTIQKHETSYVLFEVDGNQVGKMQVKFNNGFLERCKRNNPDFTVDNIPMVKGAPLTSWNFSLIY